jgi:phosphoribosylamine--glycine ligase
MGAYCPAPIVPDKYLAWIVERIFDPTIHTLKKMGIEYKGVLYAGLMVGFDGPKVLEFNVRFGDPETQALLPMLDNDLYEILMATINGNLREHNLKWKDGSSICIVLASEGYPGNYVKGLEISGIDDIKDENVLVFQAGTAKEDNKLVTSGGRVLNIVGYGNDILDAKTRTYDAISKINFNGMYYRKDIAYKALLRYHEQNV